MQNDIFPLDPGDNRPDLLLWSGWPERTTHLTTAREPRPCPVDMLECFCGAHVWIAADGRRWTWDNELHRCPPAETPLEVAEAAFLDRRLDAAADAIEHVTDQASRRFLGTPERVIPTLDDYVIE